MVSGLVWDRMQATAYEAEKVMTSVHDEFVQDSVEAQCGLDGAGDPTTGSSVLPFFGRVLSTSNQKLIFRF